MLIDAARGREFLADGLNAALSVHAADFDLSRLSTHFLLFPSILSNVESLSIESTSKTLQAKSEPIYELLDQVVKYMQLLFCTCICSFGKTLLQRFTPNENLCAKPHLTLHVHKERTATHNLEDVTKEFVTRTAERTATFGL
ncbi:hypothetical protein HPB49_002675 [Dermacentor silvarum]|uniref:Uncharacterized protein n=1 Tax=Dermacentor silvarum TaxID=543639 RepID=A0ACB8CUV1_DERSI|nr:hypothetical protein HPB49_002675 [Dermacentor silvarum]